ncbi:MAG: DUF1848 family protein [Lachnospiraceae bacterium]|nr:DUF1848 family protein [Lachnospiraceae bacterium]
MEIGKAFAEIGRRYGMTIKACAEGNDLAPYGIDCSGCMTVKTYEQALHCRLDVPKRNRPVGNAPVILPMISAHMIPAS